MKQEEKAKRYDEILESIKELYSKGSRVVVSKEEFENIFHELAESEDEKIRKTLLESFVYQIKESHPNKEWLNGIKLSEVVAWLERQGQPFDDNIITRDDEMLQAISVGLTDVVEDAGWSDFGGIPIEEIQDWLEKQGNKSKKVSIWKHWKDGIAGNGEGKQIFLIKIGSVYSISSCLVGECDYIELSELDNLLLEKQGENVNFQDKIQVDNQVTRNYNNVLVNLSQSKQVAKPADKVESEFHEGDWVVCEVTGSIYQIGQCIENLNNHKYGYDLIGGGYIGSDETEHYHRWTIADAKDGDIIACDSKYGQEIGIVKKYIGKYGGCTCFETYCFVDWDGIFRIGENMGSPNIHPATKEQRDQLEKAMKDAGYTFYFGKKELKKTEPKSKENKGNIGGFSSNSKWSEEDEKTLNEIFSVAARASLRKSTLFGKSYDYIKWQNWLKSLRPQTPAKWSEEDSKVIDNCCLLIAAADDSYEKAFKDDCIHYLQNLKQRMEQ